MNQKETKEQEFDQKVVEIKRVTRVTAGGKRFSFRALVVIGNRAGKVGVGIGKGRDVSYAIQKAIRDAQKHLIEPVIIKGGIPMEISAKFKSAKVFLRPAPQGRGIIAGGVIRNICELAGIEDVSTKVIGRTNNKINNAKATIKALEEMKRIFNLRKDAVKPTKKTR